MSGRIVLSMSVSLDGFVAAPDGAIDWVIVDEELHEAFNEEARGTIGTLFGRRMYELMAAYWPTAGEDPNATPAEREYARIWRPMTKVVFSRTLDELPHPAENAVLATRDPVTEAADLRAAGGTWGVGGPTLAAELIRADLVDEIRAYVNPIVLGGGLPLLPSLDRPLRFRLVRTRRFDAGVVLLAYERAAGTD